MSQFCKQCSMYYFGEDFKDFAGISTKAITKTKRYPVVLCESCGTIQVNHNGKCISDRCPIHGKNGKGYEE